MMTLTSTAKLSAVFALLVFAGLAGGSHYYDHNSGNDLYSQQGFSVPQYDSQAEIATELVAPFLFLTILLKFGFRKVLLFAFAEDDGFNPFTKENRNLYSREATLMAVTVTAMLIPTPFWDYVRWTASSLGLIATTLIVLVMLYLIYSFLRG